MQSHYIANNFNSIVRTDPKMMSEKTLFENLAPIIWLSKILGVPMCNKNVDRKQRIQKFFVLENVIFILSILAIATVYAIGLPSCIKNFNSLVSSITIQLLRYVSFTLTIANVVLGFFQKRKISLIIERLIKFDKVLKNTTTKSIDNEKNRKRVLSTMAIEGVLVTFLISCNLYACWQNYINALCTLTYNVSSLSNMCLQCQILIFLNELKHRFKLTNAHLATVVDEVSKHKRLVSEFLIGQLKNASHLHNELCDVARLFNRAYNGQILVKLFSSFLFIITSIFSIIIVLNNNLEKYTYSYINYMYLFIYESAEIMLLLYSFSLAEYAANETATVLFSKPSEEFCHDENVNNIVELFSLQLYVRKLKFTACELVNLDTSVIYSIIASIFTYLIFLIQFRYTE